MPGQTLATFQRNNMLDDVGSNLKTVKSFVQHNFGCCMMTDVVLVWPHSHNIVALGPLLTRQGLLRHMNIDMLR